MNTIMYLPRLGLPGKRLGDEVVKGLSLRSRRGGTAGSHEARVMEYEEEMRPWKGSR